MKKKIILIFASFIFVFGFSFSVFSVPSPDANSEWFLLPYNQFKDDYVGVFDSELGTYSADLGDFLLNGDIAYTGAWPGFTVSDPNTAVISRFVSGHKYLFYCTFKFWTVSSADYKIDSLSIRKVLGNSNDSLWFDIIDENHYYRSSETWHNLLAVYDCNEDFMLTSGSSFYLHTVDMLGAEIRQEYINDISWGIYVLDITDSSVTQIAQVITELKKQNEELVKQNNYLDSVNSVITGSVNTAPLTSGVNNIVGNVTSMIPETTDIPYVSDALGSLTQLTNIAAAEIGAFFDPFFTADMTVNIAGVSFNPFLTFLIIGVVITLITFAIKIFTRGDHER